MNRFLYFAGFAYIAICGAVIVREMNADLGTEVVALPVAPVAPNDTRAGTTGEQWFTKIKPFCNPVEVDVRTRFTPPPSTAEGAGFAAACFALAGKIDRARAIIEGMPPNDRPGAANVVFNVAHPVADAGDDRASGPMMELVLEFWPTNYMALYHAGMSAFVLGRPAIAEKHLRSFLQMYNADDGFTAQARQALQKIAESNATTGVRLRLRPLVERDSTHP
jgi:hypothetical protein